MQGPKDRATPASKNRSPGTQAGVVGRPARWARLQWANGGYGGLLCGQTIAGPSKTEDSPYSAFGIDPVTFAATDAMTTEEKLDCAATV
jgi:hypothetical protein